MISLKRQRKILEEFKVVFTKTAEKDINKLEPKTRIKILQATKSLEVSPFPKGNAIKKLRGIRISLYRLRIGDFRVIYHIDSKKIVVLYVVDRKNLEKRLKLFL